MRKLMIMMLTVVLLLTSCGVEADSTESVNMDIGKYSDAYLTLFDDSYVHEINIEIAGDDYEAMLDDPLAEEFYSADITIDGHSLENVAVRTKGNSTLRDVASSDSERYSLKIKMNEYEDQKLLGLDELVLNNMYSDASYMREFISYDAIVEVGSIAPESSYINVYINGELVGLYLLVESVDDSFLNRNYGDNDGNLYRMDSGSTLVVEDGSYHENANQKNGDDESKEDLYHFMDILNNMPEGEKGDIESVLDVESALNYLAVNTLFESYDSYNGQFAQNFYLYNDDGVFNVIPWDYNMSFGTFGNDLINISIYAPVSNTSIEERPLIDNLLAVDEYRVVYEEILESYMAYFEGFEEKVADLKVLIEADVLNDPTNFSTLEAFDASTEYQEGGAVEVGFMNGGKAMPSGEMMGTRPGGQMPDRAFMEKLQQKGEMTKEELIRFFEDEGQVVPDDEMLEQLLLKQGQMTDRPNQEKATDNPEGKLNGERSENMGGTGVSIINVIQARIENIRTQLAE